jgi:hypothetical protein
MGIILTNVSAWWWAVVLAGNPTDVILIFFLCNVRPGFLLLPEGTNRDEVELLPTLHEVKVTRLAD